MERMKIIFFCNVRWPPISGRSYIGRLGWESPAQISARSVQNRSGFGKGKKAKVLRGCGVLAVFWVLWMERNRRIFEVYEGVWVEDLWERVQFWAALWASVSEAFKDYSFSCILRN